MAQTFPPPFDPGASFRSEPDLSDTVGQKYPGVVRVSLLISVLAMSWSGVFAGALMVTRLVRHLAH